MSRPILPKEYRMSDIRSKLNVSSLPSDDRSMHMLFAVLINDIDRRADIHQSIKPEIMEGLGQAWLYFAENHDPVDVIVEQHRHGVNTEIDDPEDDRPASSITARPGSDSESVFNERLRDRVSGDVSLGEFYRDMRRLDDLRRQYSSPGLNTFEGNEVRDLREKYGLSHREWWQRQYLSDDVDSTSPSAQSLNTAPISD